MATEDDIVISGLSGRFPECDNFDDFKHVLLEGIDPITIDNRRYPPGALDTPLRLGKINNVDRFDATYFGVSPKQANLMDPRQRIMFETAYETIVDAGYNPAELRGSRTGVYVGCGSLDSAHEYKNIEKTQGYTIIGLTLSQIANRTSYIFDFKGPSYIVDTACSSGMTAFVAAVDAIESGQIDAAIVSAVQLIFHPHEASEFNKLNMLAQDGKCKVFSTLRDGYVRSEHVATLLLQKRKNARRVYSTVLGAKMNSDGYKEDGITCPSAAMQLELTQELYTSRNVDPSTVDYVEFHGTGTRIGDIEECASIYQMFCKNRKNALPVGSVKSNVGHAEVAAAMASIFKVIVAMETEVIPANLHCENLDKSLPGIKEGALKVVTENMPWNPTRVSLNSFGFGGSNSHLILEANYKTKQTFYRQYDKRLVFASGRTPEAVTYFLEGIEKTKNDAEFLALTDELNVQNMDRFNYRGYKILGTNIEEIANTSQEKRPLFFVYTGMGCHWNNMCKDLLNFDVFKTTFTRCANVLKEYNVNLFDVVTSNNSKPFENVLNCFCAIACTEIALTDLLMSFNLTPDGIIGHSLGEVGCAYADGHLTPEEAALIAFARGHSTTKAKNIIPGLMAAVGLSPDLAQTYLPEDVIVACRNSSNSSTISGPKESILKVVENFKNNGIFAKIVNTGEGYAFHSKYLNDAGEILYHFVNKIIKKSTLRTSRWISSSWPEDEWDKNDIAKYHSAEYHFNNFVSPVLFDQTFKYIPDNAIVLEVAPHGLLQSILKKELPKSVTVLPLVNRMAEDNVVHILSTIGKIYINGGNPNLRRHYDEVKFPVSRGTPSISPLIKWDHSTKWFIPLFNPKESFGKKITINIRDESHRHLEGHKIDDRILLPATGYLELVWRILAKTSTKKIEDIPVVFENIKILRATVLPLDEDVSFLVNIMSNSGNFEITESGSIVCTGTISIPKDIKREFSNLKILKPQKNGSLPMTENDVYKLYHLKKYQYSGLFKGIQEIDVNGNYGILKWNSEFTPFMDTMLQMTLLGDISNDLMLPTFIQKVVIDPRNHLHFCEDNVLIPVVHDKYLNIVKSEFIEIIGLESSKAPKKQILHNKPNLESCTFVPFENILKNDVDVDLSILYAIQIVLENISQLKTLKIVNIIQQNNEKVRKHIEECVSREPQWTTEFLNENRISSANLIVFDENIDNCENILNSISSNAFILYKGNRNFLRSYELVKIYENIFDDKGILLLKKHQTISKSSPVIKIENNDFGWLEQIKQILKNQDQEIVYIYSQNEVISGILGLSKTLALESSKTKFKCYFIRDKHVENFDQTSEFYKNQLEKNLDFNVFSNGVWGSYRYSPLKKMQNILVQNACNEIQTIGDLTSLTWVERPKDMKLRNSEVAYIYYSALNYKDIMLVTGKLLQQNKDPRLPSCTYGVEFSGITKNSKRIMGITPGMSLALQVATDPLFTWEIPHFWTLEDAATVPIVYATNIYAMKIRGQIKEGESILIHAGAGGIGISAISLALHYNCEVFTTCGSKEKKEYLLKLFPKLKEENIGNSRDNSFEYMIKNNTKGRGVDLVLNSLANDLFQASLRCIANKGRFLEIGKVDFVNGTNINSKIFLKNCSFHGVFLDDLFSGECSEKIQIKKEMEVAIKMGIINPLPRTVFKDCEVEDAFRYMSSGKHRGKVVIKIRDEIETKNNILRTISAMPKIYFDPRKVYIIIGGLGGFGLELTKFLISRNATKIVLNSRNGITNGYQSYCMKKWSNLNNVTIKIDNKNTSNMDQTKLLIESTINEFDANIGGIFHLALVLNDSLLENQTYKKFCEVFDSKSKSLRNLDTLSRELCPKLDHFVAFSSIACGRGNAGQSNYSMANSIMERICEKRKNDGLPSLAIQWGIIGDVGRLAEKTNLNVTGLTPQSIDSCFESLEHLMLQPNTIVASHVIQSLNTLKISENSNKSPSESIAHVLGIKDINKIDKNQTLTQLGLDSLMVSEIKQTLFRNFNLELQSDEIKELTFAKIEKISLKSNTAECTNLENGTDSNKIIISTIDAVLPQNMIIEIKNNTSEVFPVFFLSPIESKIDLMVPLAKKLKCNIYGIQYTKDINFESIEEYGNYFYNKIKSIQNRGPYTLIGYSFGCAVSFEIALNFEKNNEVVELVFLDGSPSFVNYILQQGYFRNGENVLRSQSKIMEAFLKMFDRVDYEQGVRLIKESKTWEKMVENISEFLSKDTQYNYEEIRVSIEMFYKKILAGFKYKPKNSFKGNMTLIRSMIDYLDFPDDYKLNSICDRDVNIYKLEGNHKEIFYGDSLKKMAEIVNDIVIKSQQ